MQRSDDSIHWQNVQMYLFGLLFNVVRLTGEDVVAGLTQWEGGWGPGALGGGGGAGSSRLGGAEHRLGYDGGGAFGIDGESIRGGGGGGEGRGSGGSGSGVSPPWFMRVFEGHSVLSTLVVLNLACAG